MVTAEVPSSSEHISYILDTIIIVFTKHHAQDPLHSKAEVRFETFSMRLAV